MRYFLDTEFIERFHKPLFGKARHVIDLISIGIVAEDGRELYLISNEFNPKDASEWVHENVLGSMVHDWVMSCHGDKRNWALDQIRGKGGRGSVRAMQSDIGKSNKEIMYEIVQFLCSTETASEYAGVGSLQDGLEGFLRTNPPEFYGYYADYDWVLFCSLFGTMMDLPKGFPMYCRDLKQMKDEAAKKHANERGEFMVCDDEVCGCFPRMEDWAMYPKQSDEHNALADARWNKKLYDFLLSI